MRFSALQRRVQRCEQVVAVRLADTRDNWSTLSQVWRRGWSPLRIVVVGVASGFVVGKLEVPGKVNAARWLQMVGSVSSLFASAQAAFASAMAAHAAETADQAADQADETADKVDTAHAAASARTAEQRTPATAATANPAPAEAATELSER